MTIKQALQLAEELRAIRSKLIGLEPSPQDGDTKEAWVHRALKWRLDAIERQMTLLASDLEEACKATSPRGGLIFASLNGEANRPLEEVALDYVNHNERDLLWIGRSLLARDASIGDLRRAIRALDYVRRS